MLSDNRTDRAPTLIREDADRSPVIVAVGDQWRYGVLPEGAEPVGEGFDEASGLPRRIRWLKDNAEMALVPAGEFLMGSTDADSNASSAEKPQHRVRLDAYYTDVCPVTVGQYRAFCQDAHPVVDVTWHDSAAYSEWAGKKLPTEAQWEKAARGTDGRIWPWGNQWNGQAAHCDYQHKCQWSDTTAPVGSHPQGVSPYGCHDLIGNVWEWCADWYDDGYYKRSPGTPGVPEQNPRGPEFGTGRVLRGGSWFVDCTLGWLRCAYRRDFVPDLRLAGRGFRCAQDLPVPSLPL